MSGKMCRAHHLQKEDTMLKCCELSQAASVRTSHRGIRQVQLPQCCPGASYFFKRVLCDKDVKRDVNSSKIVHGPDTFLL